MPECQNGLQPRSYVLYVPIQLPSEIMQKITSKQRKLLIFLCKLGTRSQKSPQIQIQLGCGNVNYSMLPKVKSVFYESEEKKMKTCTRMGVSRQELILQNQCRG